MTRRRKPDDWDDIQPGDILSFAPRAGSRCPDRTYVRSVDRDSAGRVVLSGTSDLIVEHVSYRMRLDTRGLNQDLMNAGIDLSGGMVMVKLYFDWEGKFAPTVSVQVGAGEGLLDRDGPGDGTLWDVTLDRDGSGDDIIMSVWTPPELPDFTIKYVPRRHLMRFHETSGNFSLVGRDERVVLCGEEWFGFGESAPFDDLFASSVIPTTLCPNPRPVLDHLTDIAAWIHAHPERSMDPALRMHRNQSGFTAHR